MMNPKINRCPSCMEELHTAQDGTVYGHAEGCQGLLKIFGIEVAEPLFSEEPARQEAGEKPFEMTAFEKWKAQGRTPEQIWAVENFLTGAGSDLVSREEFVKMVEGMQRDTHGVHEPILRGDIRTAGIVNHGYNLALSDLLAALNKETKT